MIVMQALTDHCCLRRLAPPVTTRVAGTAADLDVQSDSMVDEVVGHTNTNLQSWLFHTPHTPSTKQPHEQRLNLACAPRLRVAVSGFESPCPTSKSAGPPSVVDVLAACVHRGVGPKWLVRGLTVCLRMTDPWISKHRVWHKWMQFCGGCLPSRHGVLVPRCTRCPPELQVSTPAQTKH